MLTLLTISFFFLLSTPSLPSPLIDQLNQPPPPDFPAAIAATCLHHPAPRYCTAASSDLPNIFKSTVVASHLCNLSLNPDCPAAFLAVDLRSLPKLAPLFLSFSFFWKYCPLSIQSINLSNNSLAGPFPSQILQCAQIQSLDLSRNKLSGELPVAAFFPLANLSRLNLSYNQFAPLPDEKAAAFLLERFKGDSFMHSGLVRSGKDVGFGMTAAILLVVGVSALAASAIGCLAWRLVRRHEFSEGGIRRMTEGFSEDRLVEKRGDVEVYRGFLRDGEEVEIVRMHRGKKMFLSVEDCRVLVNVRHKNIVRVLGWCDGRELRAVVMKRVDGERLGEWILSVPSWRERMRVVVEVGEAMRFLEEEWPEIGCCLKGDSVIVNDGGEPVIMMLKVHDHGYDRCSRGLCILLFVLIY